MVSKKFFCKKLRQYFRDYCQASSIHGIKYMAEKRTYLERGWWLTVFLVCLSCCGYFTTTIYQKWENSPVIVSLTTRETPIYEIPFPAVTICPEIKVIKEMYDYSKIEWKLNNNIRLTKEEYKSARYMDLLCETGLQGEFSSYNNSEFSSFNNNSITDNEFYDFMFEVVPNLFSNFVSCKWMNQNYNCSKLFNLILTDEGLCATFNMLDRSAIYKDDVILPEIPFDSGSPAKNITWSLDNGYANDQTIITYPRRALFSGAKNSLKISLQEFKAKVDTVCKMSQEGFKVVLHTPSRVPRPSQQYIRLPLNEVVVIAVQPVMTTTTESVKVFKPEKRKCYFENEKFLRFFKSYSQMNCQLECLTNFTYNDCGCVAFYMPRTNGTPICGSLSKFCNEKAEILHEMGHLIQALGYKLDTYELECDCLPLCTDLNYNIETSSSSWNWKNIIKDLSQNQTMIEEMIDESGMTMSNLIIYFKHNRIVTSKQHELYGPPDFLSNFGGLLGLFTGFSILSLMEIIYFSTVRIICNVKLYGNWYGDEKKQ